MNLLRSMRGQWRLGPLVEIVVAIAVLLVIGVVVVLALSGCNSRTRYLAAQTTWSAVEAADELGARQYSSVCPHERPTPEELANCRETIRRLDTLIPIGERFVSLATATRVVRDTATAAMLALWAAEQGEEPRDLRTRLSCLAAALHVLAIGFESLHVELPVVMEQALTAIVAYGGVARDFVLGECPGWDGSGDPPHGETPPPTRDGGHSGTTRDPFVADGGAS